MKKSLLRMSALALCAAMLFTACKKDDAAPANTGSDLYKRLGSNAGIKKVVDDFFTAFHAKDTVVLRELCHSEIVMRTVANTKEGCFGIVLFQFFQHKLSNTWSWPIIKC